MTETDFWVIVAKECKSCTKGYTTAGVFFRAAFLRTSRRRSECFTYRSGAVHFTKGAGTMIKVNGEALQDADGMSVSEFLSAHGYPDKMIAVECNGTIISRKDWDEVTLKDGDAVEVVRFVGGG